MIVSLIVAASENNAIGKGNKLLWHLPNDMKFFKNTTWGMPIIMGRRTYQSISKDPLPGRYNIVITRTDWSANRDDVWIAHNFEEAIAKAAETDCKEVFITGGGQIYEAAMERADKIYMTRVHAVLEGDVYFPSIDPDKWKKVYHLDFPADAKHGFPYSFETWTRVNKK